MCVPECAARPAYIFSCKHQHMPVSGLVCSLGGVSAQNHEVMWAYVLLDLWETNLVILGEGDKEALFIRVVSVAQQGTELRYP